MDYIFRVETDRDQAACQALVSARYRLYHQRTAGILYLAAALLGLLAGLLWPGTDDLRVTWICRIGLMAGCMLAVKPLRWRRELRVCDERAADLVQQEEQRIYGREYAFFEPCFRVWDEQDSRICYYGAVTDLVETPAYFILFLGEEEGHVLRKADFTIGDPEEFPAFLSEVCGRTWHELSV